MNMLPQLLSQSLPACTTSNSTIRDTAIFQLQTIKINNNKYSIFFNSGYGDFVSRYMAVYSLTSNAFQEHLGPIITGQVGGLTSVSQHGIYKVNIPLHDGTQATMSRVYLDKTTSTFSTYLS